MYGLHVLELQVHVFVQFYYTYMYMYMYTLCIFVDLSRCGKWEDWDYGGLKFTLLVIFFFNKCIFGGQKLKNDSLKFLNESLYKLCHDISTDRVLKVFKKELNYMYNQS